MHAGDRETLLADMQVARDIVATEPLARHVVAEVTPGDGVTGDEALLDYAARTGATLYHPVGTCRMGSDPSTSVVDAALRVRGVARLRVADASVFPNLTSGNTNAPAIMVGERASDLIRDAGR